jgi:hypothetical protein
MLLSLRVIALLLLLPLSVAGAGSQFYVSSSEGDDANSGEAPSDAWASVGRVGRASLRPGDTVVFKSGDVFYGQLVINDSGEQGAPIHFTSYGEGAPPVVDGSPAGEPSALAAVLIEDQDHLEMSRLTIRNFRKVPLAGAADVNAYGILVRNKGARNLRGFEFHHLEVEEVYPVRARKSFNETSVSGIRFETTPAKSARSAVNTGDIYLHDNEIRHTARFGIAVRHRASREPGVTGTRLDYDVDVRVVNNWCEDLGGSCVLLNGIWAGLLEGNTFLRSGALVEPELSVNRGSGAWFFRSRHVLAQHNVGVSSRGHNDSSGLHVDFGNEDVLVQYNFFADNEGYGTEILGKNKNVIWRFNISVGDGTRKMNVVRPEGGKSRYPGKTIFVSDFAVPKRVQSEGVYIYNNTYFVTSGSDPFLEFNGRDVHAWNNAFLVESGGRLGRKLNVGWTEGTGLDLRGNVYSGDISPNFIRLDSHPAVGEVRIAGEAGALARRPADYAIDAQDLAGLDAGVVVEHPRFPLAGQGIFGHVDPIPRVDFFDNVIPPDLKVVGAGRAVPGTRP